MKINEVTIGERVRYGTPQCNAVGTIVDKDKETFDILDAATHNIYRVASECIVATVRSVTVEKATPVEHPKSFSFEFVPTGMERNFSNIQKGTFFSTGYAHIKDESRWEEKVRLPWSDKVDPMSIDKKYKVTVEEIL